MGKLSKHFIDNFHDLPGLTIKEKHQNLFELLHQNKATLLQEEEELNYITTNLKANNHLEKIFLIDFLIYFKRFEELLQHFMAGDEITLSKITKQEWFFQKAFKNVGAEEFVDEILPTMSYSVKLKILRRLKTSEKQSDEIFDALYKRYGLYLATIFLPKCTVGKIDEILKKHLIKLTSSQLKLIYNKDPSLVCLYFEERCKHEGNADFMNNNPILVFIAQKNPEMFSQLFNKFKFDVQLGNRTTKNYIVSQKSDVLDKPESYLKILNKSKFFRKLGYEVKDTLFKDNWKDHLKYFPKNQRFNIFKSTYNSIYHHKFGDNVDVIDEDMLKLITDPLEREKIAKIKLQKEENERYLIYVTPKYCWDECMSKINQMTTSERTDHLKYMIDNCFLNKNFDYLLKVFELVAVRFKNDRANIRSEFFYLFYEQDKILEQLTEQHWKFILDIIVTSQAKDEYIFCESLLFFKYLEFLIKNGQPFREVISKYQSSVDSMSYQEYWKDNSKIVKKILCELLELGYKKKTEASEEEAEDYDCRIASLCKDYNDNNPKDTIDILNHARLIESAKNVLKSERHLTRYESAGISHLVCQNNPSESVKELQNLYFKTFKMYGEISAIFWFLKNDPKTLQENFDVFLEQFDEDYFNRKRLWRFFKKHSHLEFDKKIVEFCISKLKDESYEHKKEIVKPLTILASVDTHLELVKTYLPTSAKVELSDDEVKDLYNLQCAFINCLHLLKSPRAILPITLEFCKGDYLKAALSPLYSSVYKLPEVETRSITEKLDKVLAVSVKKHAVHLSCQVQDKKSALKYLEEASVPSLMPTLKYLGKNPSDSAWKILESKLANVKRDDLSVFKWSANIVFPLEFRSKYIESVWAILDKFENKEIRKLLIKKIDKNIIERLHPDFVYKVIKGSIFKIEEANDLVATLLIYLKDEDKFEFLSKILATFKECYWNCKETRRSARRKLNTFIQSILKIYLESENPSDFEKEFSKIFNSLFLPFEAFDEFVMVSFMKLKGESVENCAKFLIKFNNDFLKTFGKSVVYSIADAIHSYIFSIFFKTQEEQLKFCYFLLKAKQTVEDYLLIIKLLPQSEPKDAKHFKFYDEILTDLEQVNDDFVSLQFNQYLKSESSDYTNNLGLDVEFDWRKIAVCPRRPSS